MGRRGRPRRVGRLRRGGGAQPGAALNRGNIYEVELPSGPHPAVVVTRDAAIPVLRNVCVAAVTSTIRDLPTEVPLGPSQGLARECVVNCDNLFTIPKSVLGRLRGELGPVDTDRLNRALRVALDLD